MSSNTGPIPGDVFDVKKVRKFIELMNEHDLAEIDQSRAISAFACVGPKQ